MSTLIHQLSLCLIDGLGPVLAKRLVSHCGTAEAVFLESRKALTLIPGIRPAVVNQITGNAVRIAAEREMTAIERLNINTSFFTEKSYPTRLKMCEDGPIMLFTKGLVELNPRYALSFVGTRKASRRGTEICHELISGLSQYNPLIVSGMAYGIDIHAHRAALDVGLPTIACLGHGLDRLYPQTHRRWADQMQNDGGLVTEFMTGTKPDRENFPKRNRLIAGMSDATIVVESDVKGGSMITAYIAQSYGREVMAVPGKPGESAAVGCNELIRRNVAGLVSHPEHIIEQLGWDIRKKSPVQRELFPDLPEEEENLYRTLHKQGPLAIDELSLNSRTELRKLSGQLLSLELKGLVRALPGKVFEAT